MGGGVVDCERQNAPVGEADTPCRAFLAAWFVHQHGRRPVHVIERQPCIGERPLPGRPLVATLALGLDTLNRLRQIGFSGAKLDAAGAALVARKPLLQRPLHRTLQQRVDGRAHRVRVGRDRIDAGDRSGFPRDFVHEMEADIPARPFIGRELRQRRQSRRGLLGADGSILAQPTQDIGQPFLRPTGMPVGTEIVGPLREPSQQCGLLELEVTGGFSKIAARPQFDAPGAAAEIDGIEIELEDFRLAERVLDPRRHDHLADLALVGEVIAH